MTDLTDIVVITGGSRGIGAACARSVANAGYRVALISRNNDTAEQVCTEIEKAGGNVKFFAADVRSESSVESAFKHIDGWGGRLAGLVNCAGVSGGRFPFSSIPADQFMDTINTNLLGTVFCCREAARRMALHAGGAGGSIVNVSSTAVDSGGFNLSAYVATKGGVNALTKSLSVELGSDAIRVNCLSPGIIATEQQPLDDPDWLERTIARIPLNRLGEPEDVAKAAVWLLSDEASFISGANLRISGGM